MTDLIGAEARVDTREMVLIHTFVRREFRLAAGVVRRVPSGEHRRAEPVAAHVQFLAEFLHHHHTIEDEFLWPLLLERVPDDLAPIVHLMESQHERLDRILDELGHRLGQWRTSASAEDRELLAATLDEAYVHVVEHLDAEEARLLPIAARTLAQEEWDRLGVEGRKRSPRRHTALTLGMFQYEGDPEVFAGMLAKVPAPIRMVLLWRAGSTFRRHAQLIHGTTTP
ncbi:MAG: hemerythrin domain-containing protein [Brachybacterium paraconglomeratum]|nr:hemerythrin domain-containing protein [Brachybacterium paraconglomeratum]